MHEKCTRTDLQKLILTLRSFTECLMFMDNDCQELKLNYFLSKKPCLISLDFLDIKYTYF